MNNKNYYLALQNYDKNIDVAWKLLIDFKMKSNNNDFLDATNKIKKKLNENLNLLYRLISEELERLEEVQDA